MYYKQLEGFLQNKTAELSQQLQEIIGDIVPIYNTGTDIAMDNALMCFLQALFGQSCKTFLDIVACPNWTKLQSVGQP